MNETTFPVQSKATLIKASIIALLFASFVYVLVILPAEYNVDPTGFGNWVGLSVLAQEVKAENQAPPVEQQSAKYQESMTSIIVPPNKGVEYKFKLAKYANLSYQWATNGEPLYFDFHGEPKGDTTGYFESYAIATTHQVKGSMTVPFDGVHGWYWKNNSEQEITITLKTQGNYEIVGLIH